jgi:chromosome partitioning protein
MMSVIALVGNKGGAGKTTLSLNLATGLARHKSVAIIDADPQGSAFQWRAISDIEQAPKVYEAETDLVKQVNEFLEEFDYIVIDCPPSVHASQTNTVLRLCDLALIPVQPSPVDLWATVHIERAIEEAREVNPQLRAYLVINQLEARTTLSRLVRDALTEIALPVAAASIRRRAIYRASALEGRSVFHMGRRGRDAVNELDILLDEVIT